MSSLIYNSWGGYFETNSSEENINNKWNKYKGKMKKYILSNDFVDFECSSGNYDYKENKISYCLVDKNNTSFTFHSNGLLNDGESDQIVYELVLEYHFQGIPSDRYCSFEFNILDYSIVDNSINKCPTIIHKEYTQFNCAKEMYKTFKD
jgi:hypothetical protein